MILYVFPDKIVKICASLELFRALKHNISMGGSVRKNTFSDGPNFHNIKQKMVTWNLHYLRLYNNHEFG